MAMTCWGTGLKSGKKQDWHVDISEISGKDKSGEYGKTLSLPGRRERRIFGHKFKVFSAAQAAP